MENVQRLWLQRLLILAAIGLLVAIYYSPIWWVSLTAPNYPKEAFPDGVRIHFHMNGVFNGCKPVKKAEVAEEEALDCVHEMDTINHYVGMYPIAAGGVVEKAYSQFLMTLLGIMLLGFLCTRPKVRIALMGIGFAALAVWMALAWYGENGIRYENKGYIEALVQALSLDLEKEEEAAVPETGSAIIERLKQSLEASGVAVEETKSPGDIKTKDDMIDFLRASFEADQARKPAAERQAWHGSVRQVMSWHYEKTLGRYFNEPERIRPMVHTMTLVGDLVFWGVLVAMLVLLWGARRNRGPLYWLLVVVPMALPVFFVIEYAGWLWWYGHNLNAMGAFTVKPFMPTVFGDGKVAQFTTHSYPHYGFGLMLLLSALLIVAAVLRRRDADDATR